MKINSVVATFLFLGSTVVASANIDEVKESLEPWSPLNVRMESSTLTITTQQRQVTDTIYRAMIGGLCMGTITYPSSLDGVSEVRVLNQFGQQGYVFEGGKAECEELNSMPISSAKIYILGRSRMN